MSDMIDRQKAIEALQKEIDKGKPPFNDTIGAVRCGVRLARNIIEDLPSVQEREEKMGEWCHDCKEYDNDRHCCPRWNRVIRNTVEELKAEHLPSVQERKGHDTGESRWFHCSECGYGVFDVYLDDEQKYDLAYHYCPNCGAHMEGAEDDD